MHTSTAFMESMFGPVHTGKHTFVPESGFPGANGNICCVPDLEQDPTHLCGRTEHDPIHSSEPVSFRGRVATMLGFSKLGMSVSDDVLLATLSGMCKALAKESRSS